MTYETILDYLNDKLISANYNEFTFKIPGETITISPCSNTMIFDRSDIEYYMIYSDIIHSCDSLETIAQQIVDCEETKERLTKEQLKIRAFFDKYIDTDTPDYDSWDFYCDWHKDVFGYKPRGISCGGYVSDRNNKS